MGQPNPWTTLAQIDSKLNLIRQEAEAIRFLATSSTVAAVYLLEKFDFIVIALTLLVGRQEEHSACKS